MRLILPLALKMNFMQVKNNNPFSQKKKSSIEWYNEKDPSFVMPIKSWKSTAWKIFFVIAQILWFWAVPLTFSFRSEKIIMSKARRNFEMFIDLTYLVHSILKPFMAISRKQINKKL